MKQTASIELDGLPLEVVFFYTPADYGDNWTPPYGETYEIDSVNISGIDMIEFLENNVPNWEELIINKIKEL